MKVQIGDVLQTRPVRFYSIAPKTVLYNKRPNDGQAIKDVLLIIDRNVGDVLEILLWKNDKMKSPPPEWMFDRDTPVCLLYNQWKCGSDLLNSGGSKQAGEIARPIAGVAVEYRQKSPRLRIREQETA
jgi:hypothetical protein